MREYYTVIHEQKKNLSWWAREIVADQPCRIYVTDLNFEMPAAWWNIGFQKKGFGKNEEIFK